MATAVIVVGPAGSGKSRLTGAYKKWLIEVQGAAAAAANLDPAAEYVPYDPDYDVRKLVDAHEIAKTYGLGPNGALVKSMEILAEHAEDVAAELASLGAEYVIVDTPGQMEVFLFRSISWKLTEALAASFQRIAAIFVMDATVVRDPADYATLLLLSTAVQLRLGIDVAPALNKVDAAGEELVAGDVYRDLARLRRRLAASQNLYSEMLRDLVKRLAFYSKRVNVPRVSAATGKGMEELHRLVLEMSCACGDLS
ncbi:MAG: ATP/GTP-binding protein [Thermoproteota archaeon]